MFLKVLPFGLLASNCYILGDEKKCVVIDPGVEANKIMETVNENKLKVKYIILTHAHYDHIAHMESLKEITGADILVHEEDNIALTDGRLNGSMLFGSSIKYMKADKTLKDGDKLSVGNLTLDIIHTPGHSPGGICILCNDMLFSGDTLFYGSVGRSDLGRGDHNALINAIKEKLLVLPDETTVYPGHGAKTSIGYERNNNPFIV